MDKIDVEHDERAMGNGVNSYTQEILLKGSTLYVKLSICFMGRTQSRKTKIINMINEELKKMSLKKLF